MLKGVLFSHCSNHGLLSVFNEYPAKACIGCSIPCGLINSSNYQRMLHMQQEMEHQRHLQQRMERMQRRQAAQRYGSLMMLNNIDVGPVLAATRATLVMSQKGPFSVLCNSKFPT